MKAEKKTCPDFFFFWHCTLVLQMWVWILIGHGIIPEVRGFSDGNFPESCKSLLPQHPGPDGDFSAQTTEPPFEVTSQLGNNGDPVTGTDNDYSSSLGAYLSLSTFAAASGHSLSLVFLLLNLCFHFF